MMESNVSSVMRFGKTNPITMTMPPANRQNEATALSSNVAISMNEFNPLAAKRRIRQNEATAERSRVTIWQNEPNQSPATIQFCENEATVGGCLSIFDRRARGSR